MKVLDSFSQFSKKLYGAIAEQLNSRAKKNRKNVEFKIRLSIESWIRDQPEIEDLLGNSERSMNYLFGLEPGKAERAVEHIVKAISDSIIIDMPKISNRLESKIEFRLSANLFGRLILDSSANVITEKGTRLEWLNWLLQEGDKIIIYGYHYRTGDNGRSGGGTMVKRGVFRVPPEFSGTIDDNFITRAFLGREEELSNIIQGLFR